MGATFASKKLPYASTDRRTDCHPRWQSAKSFQENENSFIFRAIRANFFHNISVL